MKRLVLGRHRDYRSWVNNTPEQLVPRSAELASPKPVASPAFGEELILYEGLRQAGSSLSSYLVPWQANEFRHEILKARGWRSLSPPQPGLWYEIVTSLRGLEAFIPPLRPVLHGNSPMTIYVMERYVDNIWPIISSCRTLNAIRPQLEIFRTFVRKSWTRVENSMKSIRNWRCYRNLPILVVKRPLSCFFMYITSFKLDNMHHYSCSSCGPIALGCDVLHGNITTPNVTHILIVSSLKSPPKVDYTQGLQTALALRHEI